MNHSEGPPFGANAHRRALLVLGMHRSGTSLAAALLCAAGLDGPANGLPADRHNERGYWEPRLVQEVDDQILAHLGLDWHSPLAVPTELLGSMGEFEERVARALQGEFSSSPLFCVKDPRICRLLPVWIPALAAAQVDASYIIIVRNPLEVSESLKQRDGFHWSKSIMLWLRHVVEAEQYTRDKPRAFITYDQLMNDWRATLQRIGERLNISWPRRHSEIDVRFDQIHASGLWHHRSSSASLDLRADISQWIRDVYRVCDAAARDDSTNIGADFDRIRGELLAADKAFEPMLLGVQAELGTQKSTIAAVEQLARQQEAQYATIDARLHQTETEITEATARLAERDAQLASLKADFHAAEREREELRAAYQNEVALLTKRVRQLQGDLYRAEEGQALSAVKAAQRSAELALVAEQHAHTTSRYQAAERQAEVLREQVDKLGGQLSVAARQLRHAQCASSATEMDGDQHTGVADGARIATTAAVPMQSYLALTATADADAAALQARLRQLMERIHAAAARSDNGKPLLAPGGGDTLGTRLQRPEEGAGDLVLPAGGENFLHPDVYAFFDSAEYYRLYQDIEKSGLDALEHWLTYGRVEGRIGPGTRPYVRRSCAPAALLSTPFGVNFIGQMTAATGLGTAARGYLDALHAAGIPTNAASLDIRLYQQSGEAFGALPRTYNRYRVNIVQQNCDMIANMCRVYGHRILDDRYNIFIWAWELPAFRTDWFSQFGAADEIWGLSEFCSGSIASVSPVAVRTMPCVVNPGQPNPLLDRAYFGLPTNAFIFCFMFDVSSVMERKNPLALVAAFRLAFGADIRAHLVLKFHSTDSDTYQMKRLYDVTEAPNIKLFPEMFSDEETLALKNACDCFVSPHRSEGFGLNIAEMMYLGKPVIATRYSGNLDFMSEENSYFIDCSLTEITEPMGPYPKGFVWADPSVEHLAAQMRRVYQNRDEASLKGERAAADIRANQSANAVGQKILARLKELDLAADSQQSPRFTGTWGEARAAAWKSPLARIAGLPWEGRVLNLTRKPTISLVVPVYNTPAPYLRACIESVQRQQYPFWELCLCNDASSAVDTLQVLREFQGTDGRIKVRHLPENRGISAASNAAAEMATGEFLALLDHDDELRPSALLRVAEVINEQPEADYFYTDEDKINEHGEHVDDFCKPDWSPEHLESVMYLLHLQVFRKTLFLEIGGFRDEYAGAQDYDLALRISRRTSKIVHIPEILYHWRMIPGSAAAVIDAKPEALDNAFSALCDHTAARYGTAATVEKGLFTGSFRVRRKLHNEPVTIMIPTDNRSVHVPERGEINLVDHLIGSIRRRSTYANYRILVVDNVNLTPEQHERYEQLGIRIASYDGPRSPFNFSRKANFGFRHVDTELMIMLNDDMEIISREWIESLLELAVRPEIGVVGGRLLYPNGHIQHVGMALGVNGSVAHMYHGFPGDFIGYNGYTHLIRNFSAVTGACMATRSSVIERLGGFDERFAIDFNDVDFCLRALEAGFRNVYTPYCELYHFEGVTAQRASQNVDEAQLFVKRWEKYVAADPYHNPYFAPDRIDYGLKRPLSVLIAEQDQSEGIKLGS